MTTFSERQRAHAVKSSSESFRLDYTKEFVERWDELIGWAGRTKGEGSFLFDLLTSYGVRRVLDVAAGTGFHSVRLAKAGFTVVAADGSTNMAEKAKENLRMHGCEIPMIVVDWRHLDQEISETFDAVVCLGNSFSHIASDDDRKKTLKQFFNVLSPGGLLVVDRRNYDAILDRRGGQPTRSTCGSSEGVSVSLEVVDACLVKICCKLSDGESFMVHTYPLRTYELNDFLVDAGFSNISLFGDLKQEFETDKVEFFIHVAHRQ